MKRVLVIEDNEPIRANTLELLELAGYEAFGASDGQEGLEIAKHILPAIILCDVSMPVMNGYSVLEYVKAHEFLQSIPFIFLTAHSEKVEVQQGLQMGACDYIIKPFDGDELIGTVEKALRTAAAPDEQSQILH